MNFKLKGMMRVAYWQTSLMIGQLHRSREETKTKQDEEEEEEEK